MKNDENEDLCPVLVFGIAAKLGSGASFVSEGLIEELKAYGYNPHKVKITDEFIEPFKDEENIKKEFDKTTKQYNLKEDSLSDKARRILELQIKGNLLRKKFHAEKGSYAYIASEVIYKISKKLQDTLLNPKKNAEQRQAFIIDSLKHQDEVTELRKYFRESFCMIGVVADENIRFKRLHDQKQIKQNEFDAISNIDADENCEEGQHTTKAILEADYFFENNYDTPEKINSECKRLLNLLFQSAIITPKQDEYGMNIAANAANKSACLSRQVGAAIISSTGEILSIGSNDVPQYGGGLYTSESGKDHRCFAKSMMCHNDHEKEIIADDIVRSIGEICDEQKEKIKKILLKETRLKSLIEFSRAVHAEMDAIIAVARSAKHGIVGSTMYVTTYPCHNCAKHIIDAGIKRVVYIEPYVKSLAQKLHPDAINNPSFERVEHKVSFDNYGGVSPNRYSEWFSINRERKENSKLIRHGKTKDMLLPLGAQNKHALAIRLQYYIEYKLPSDRPKFTFLNFKETDLKIIDKTPEELPKSSVNNRQADREKKI